MCGIFGKIDDCAIEAAVISPLVQASLHRGNLGFGYFSASLAGNDMQGAIYRFARPYTDSLLTIDAHQHIVLGHVRAATSGARDKRGVHPFESADLLLAHNGILLNHADFPAWQGAAGVDSETILNGIQAHLDEAPGQQTAGAITRTISQLEGQQACWLWHKRERALYLWRVMSPLFFGRTDTSLTFASTRTNDCPHPLPEGIVYRFIPFTMAWQQVATFPFTSPYLS